MRLSIHSSHTHIEEDVAAVSVASDRNEADVVRLGEGFCDLFGGFESLDLDLGWKSSIKS